MSDIQKNEIYNVIFLSTLTSNVFEFLSEFQAAILFIQPLIFIEVSEYLYNISLIRNVIYNIIGY